MHVLLASMLVESSEDTSLKLLQGNFTTQFVVIEEIILEKGGKINIVCGSLLSIVCGVQPIERRQFSRHDKMSACKSTMAEHA
jgi:hypothetical protein